MIRRIFLFAAVIATALLVISCGDSNGQSDERSDGHSAMPSTGHRLSLKVADVTASPDDTLIAVPVYLSHPQDTLAGIEIHLRVPENQALYFALDEKRADSIVVAADTAGSMLSGWEWLGVTTLDSTVYDLRLVALADWPDQNVTPPAMPSEQELLVTLYLRVDEKYPIEDAAKIEITINEKRTSFANPRGETIGLVTGVEKVCSQFVGDSCVSWKQMKVARRDSTVASFIGGSISIGGSSQ